MVAEPALIKKEEIPIATAACPGKYFLITDDSVGAKTAIARPTKNAEISKVINPV